MTNADETPPHSASGPRIGALVGLWCGLCLAGVFLASWIGWGVVAADYTIARLLAAAIAKHWGWTADPAVLATIFLLLPVIAGVVAGGLASAVGKLLRVDAGGHSLQAWCWTWSANRRWVAWIVVPVVLLFVLVWLEATSLAWIALLLYPVLPFFVSDRHLLAGEAAHWRLRWRWPGLRPLIALLLLLLFTWGLDLVVAAAGELVWEQPFPDPVWLGLPFLCAATMVLAAWTNAAGDGLWIDGAGDAGGIRRILRKALRWERVGAYVAMDFRVGAALLVFAAPWLLCSVLAIYELPQIEQQLVQQGERMPVVLQLIQEFSRGGVLWLLLTPLVVPGLLVYRRLWVVLDRYHAT